MPTDINTNHLIINKLTQAQYDAIENPSDNELYLVPEVIDTTPTLNSDNLVTSGGVASALSSKIDSSQLKTINNLSLIGTGNITIQGGGESSPEIMIVTISPDNNEGYEADKTFAEIKAFLDGGGTVIAKDEEDGDSYYYLDNYIASEVVFNRNISGNSVITKRSYTIDNTNTVSFDDSLHFISSSVNSSSTTDLANSAAVKAVKDDLANYVKKNTNDNSVVYFRNHNGKISIDGEGLIEIDPNEQGDVLGPGAVIIYGDVSIPESLTVDGERVAVISDIPAAVTESTVSGWGFTKNAGTITGITMNGASKGTSGVVDLGTVITSETALSKGTTSGNGNAVTDISVSGHQITLTKGKTFLESETDPVFSASAAANITSSDITNWNGKTSNVGTVTGVKMNGTTNNPTSGVVDLGTVITSETALSKGTTTGNGNAVTDISVNGHQITLTKGTTFLTSHQGIRTLKTDNTTAQSTSSSEAIAGSGTINLHKVAKTGTYSDLIGKPTIPTVNNATLTIQKNGTTVNTFTANASSNVTANIQVNELPTVSSSDNGKVLQVVSGAWSLVIPTAIYSGTSTPSNSVGNDGDLYLQTS